MSTGGAAALHAGCDVVLTNDRDLRRVTELRVVLLSEPASAR